MTGPNEHSYDADEELISLRHRLFDLAAGLQPLSTVDELAERIKEVVAEIHAIERELLLVVHVTLVEDELLEELDSVDRRLAEGWRPDAAPVAEVVARLRTATG